MTFMVHVVLKFTSCAYALPEATTIRGPILFFLKTAQLPIYLAFRSLSGLKMNVRDVQSKVIMACRSKSLSRKAVVVELS